MVVVVENVAVFVAVVVFVDLVVGVVLLYC